MTITSSIPQPSRELTFLSEVRSVKCELSMIATSSLLIADATVDVVLELARKDMDEVDVVGVASDGLSIENGGVIRSDDMRRWAGFSCRAIILC